MGLRTRQIKQQSTHHRHGQRRTTVAIETASGMLACEAARRGVNEDSALCVCFGLFCLVRGARRVGKWTVVEASKSHKFVPPVRILLSLGG